MAKQIYTFGADTSKRIYDSLSGPTAKASIGGNTVANPRTPFAIMRVTVELSAAGTVGASLVMGSGTAAICKNSSGTLSPTTITASVYNTHNAAIPVDTWIYAAKYRNEWYFVGAIQYCP
jgi:hypothetical protein